MQRALAVLIASVLAALGLVHLYWAGGGRRGRGAAIPEVDGRPAFSPSAGATLAVALALFAAALLVAAAGHLLGDAARAQVRFLALALALVFVARAIGDFRRVGFFKRAHGSKFARLDTWFYSPLCLALAAGIAAVIAAG